MKRYTLGLKAIFAALFMLVFVVPARAEVILQYFQMPWRALTQKMPELAEAGYNAMWLPPPTKASGGLSVGYDLWDPFDLGSKDQRNTVRTFYGTEAELHEMMRTAHRFGIRVYFDNIMNHRAFDVPGYNESTPLDIYPGMRPEDFHLRVTEDGFYRKWDNTRDWQDEWQVLHLGLSDLIDIAHEVGAGGWNHNFGPTEGSHHPGLSFVRHPDNPEYYAYDPDGNYVGFGNVTQEMLDNNPWAYEEDVNAYLIRAVRWKMDRTKADGLRLDAVKHVPAFFFGEPGNDASTARYVGGMQLQFNKTRGFNQHLDSSPNFRDTVFNTEVPRNDAMVFGEHLGAPPGFGPYIAAGMRLKDAPLRDHLNGILGSPWGSLAGMDQTGWNPHPDFADNGHAVGVQFAHSHDSDFAAARELQYAFYMTRAGLPIVYTDGYFKAGTLQDAGGAFPRHANTAFLGQFGDQRLPNLAYIREHFARGYQYGRWSDEDVVAYARVDKRDEGWGVNDAMDDRSAAVMLFMMNDNYADGQNRPINPVFGHTSGVDDSWLMNYSTYGGPFYVWASQIANGEITIPPGGYFVFSWRSPEPSDLWTQGGGRALEILQDGERPGTVSYLRRDGPDGDAQFNPMGLQYRGFDSQEEADANPFRYRMTVPRITSGTNITFRTHVDGSAYNVLMKLNGGVDLNSHLGIGADNWGNRDRAPGLANDTFLGWEDTQFAGRFWPEKFAARNSDFSKVGSAGATSYQTMVGSETVDVFEADAENDYSTDNNVIAWVYHDPDAMTDIEGGSGGETVVFGPVTYDMADPSDFSSADNAGHFNADDEADAALGSDPFGLWANSDDLSDYTSTFPQDLEAGQTIRFHYQNGGVDDTGASIGWQLRDAGGNEMLALVFSQGDSNYRFHQGATITDTGISWMNTPQTAQIEFTSPTNVSISLNGGSPSTFTLSEPTRQLRFWNYTAGETNGRNYYFNNIRITEEGGAPSGVVTNQHYLTSTSVVIWAKTPKVPGVRASLYYTTTGGDDWPEGAAGYAANVATRVASGAWVHTGVEGDTDWWRFEFPRPANDTPLRYKIGAVRVQGDDGNGWDVPFPNHPDQVARKYNMMGVWEITNFNAETIEYFPHNDYAQDLEGNPIMETGLQEGMNFIQARAFLQRDGAAPIFNTFKQTFYLDLERPTGEVKFPANNDTLPSQEYGVVVRTDPTVTEVWFNIVDSDPNNDDAATGNLNGNGFITNGVSSWVQATEVTPSLDIDSDFEREWRFTYRNIPSEGQATIRVRLMELSSTPNNQWTEAMTDEEGHFTTLEREVITSAPDLRFFFDWPTEDGQVLEEGWTMRVHFEESLGFGINDETLLDRFLIRINGSPQDRQAYQITRSIGSGLGSLDFDMPQLFNGDPDFQHLIQVTHVTGDNITLQTTRNVRAAPVETPPNLVVVDPEQFDSNGRQTEIFLPAMPNPQPEDRQYTIRVDSDPVIQDVWIEFADGVGSAGLTSGPVTNDNNVSWFFTWSNMTARTYTFTAHGAETLGGEPVNSSRRTIPVRIRQLVDQDESGDSDNDGIPDALEVSQVPLPETDSEFWNNGDVHIHRITGRTDPLMPITDGSLLPDGLQLGLTAPIGSGTDLDADTNGDGFPNFIRDLDPPLFNTFDNDWHPDFREFAGRMDQITGSMTDPSRADTDGDGLEDHQEDLNRNGRVDIGLLGSNGKVEAILMHPNIPTVYNSSRVDRGRLPSNARFLETDPNSSDTIGDGLFDGQSDVSRNGRVNMYLLHSDDSTEVLDYTDWNGDFFQFNLMPDDLDIIYWDDNNPPPNHIEGMNYAPIMSRAVDYAALFAAYNREGTGTAQSGGWPRLLITETDPLAVDTIGDGLPDGWKVRYGLDPLDDGVYNWRTGQAGDPVNGPDGDITGDGVTNMDHFLNGTDPRVNVTFVPPAGSISIGRGEELGEVNGVTRYREFIDWTWDDLRAMDAYDGDGSNHRGGDIYRAWDGWDDSRDMVAFYSRDGGDPGMGGSGRVYFRVDFHDLQAMAEQGEMDLYVAINFGDTIGERVLPDEVDTLTDMRWRVVVAVYESSLGQVYVDTDPNNNSNVFGDDLFAKGVVMRPDYYLGAYFNSELDAVEFAIDRQALTDAGWSGANPAGLRFQVYTVKSGTQNDPQGPGDIGGRSDIRDSIFNDYIAESHWNAQAGLQGAGSVLRDWIPGDHRGGRTKVALVIHGNQQIRTGVEMQNLINNNAGAGYFRPIDAHEVFGVPLNLHITPTLASAMQWAAVDPAAEQPWRDGPSFNARLGQLMNDGIISPFATTFSDHILPYFTSAYSQDSVALANEFLSEIYGFEMSQQQVFYPPERILDNSVFDQIRDMGYEWTLTDQMMHIWNWVGREAALGQDGYRINRFNGVNTFVINDRISTFRFQSHDSGAPMALRRQLNRMARSGTQDQVLIIHSSWEDFLDPDNAAAYDNLVRWLANRAWVEVVSLEDIAAHEVDVSGDGQGNEWWRIDRGASATELIGQDWIQFATLGDYSNWYDGADLRQGLSQTQFEVRPGGPELDTYGRVGFGGVIEETWNAVNSINNSALGRLARGVTHASTFVTAFHEQPTVDLRKFSIGTYIEPDDEFRSLASFARNAAAQTRRAAIYARVDQWAASAGSLTETVAVAEDIDLDGEDEFLLYNRNVFVVVERTGGRMIGAWVRNPADGRVFQTMGNFLSYSGSDTEYEGAFNVHDDGRVEARRTSGLKDWWAGTTDYVNAVYSASLVANGWTLTSGDGQISKTITLDDSANWLEVDYNVNSSVNDGVLFVRHGFSPDLEGLLIQGQAHLSDEIHDAGVMRLEHTRPEDVRVSAMLAYGGSHNAGFNIGAADDDPGADINFSTRRMRNQAQTHQVEIVGTNNFSFAIGFEVETLDEEQFNDGVPYSWLINEAEIADPGSVNVNVEMAANNVNTLKEAYIAGIDPLSSTDLFRLDSEWDVGEEGILLRWRSVEDRIYHIYRSGDLMNGEAGFLGIATNIPANPEWDEFLDDDATGTGPFFYRIGVELAPSE